MARVNTIKDILSSLLGTVQDRRIDHTFFNEVHMRRYKEIVVLVIAMLHLNTAPLHAAYVEGIDTTDVNGYGLDSTFRIYNSNLSGQIIAHYYFDTHWCMGYYNFSFEDIVMAPDAIEPRSYLYPSPLFHCFIVKDSTDQTYSKVKVIRCLSGNRYIFKFGTNTIPNDRRLVKNDYDRNARYKVNNLYFTGFKYRLSDVDTIHTSTLSWDAPLVNANNLVRYILYKTKTGLIIDTAAPINPAQWDTISLPVSASPVICKNFPDHGYFNMVAVYNGNIKSDFLTGWTSCGYDVTGAKQRVAASCDPAVQVLTIGNTGAGLSISLPQTTGNSGLWSIALFTTAGRMVGYLPVTGNTVFLSPSQWDIRTGKFVLKANLQSGKSVTTPVFLAR